MIILADVNNQSNECSSDHNILELHYQIFHASDTFQPQLQSTLSLNQYT